MFYRLFSILLFFTIGAVVNAQSLTINSDHQLVYQTQENGDRIPDYSYCGYKASEEPIPHVEAKIKVPWKEGDATERIQRAIDYVSELPMDANGFRGAILLEKGNYTLKGGLQIAHSGIVLRGSGYHEDETILIGTGTDRETLIRIVGKEDKKVNDSTAITAEYVPLNATIIPVKENHNLKAGDRIVITRPSTAEWIKAIGADKIGIYVDYKLTHWEPGDFDLKWERTVVESSPTSITIDVPLPHSLDSQFGTSYINKIQWEDRIRNVGIENLRCRSAYNTQNPKDENHRWMAITVENAEDGWIRRVTGEHFVSSIVAVWNGARRFTIEDCKSLKPVGEIGGYRRYAFQTLGEQVLFQRCYAEYGYHDFSVGFSTAGPNAFVQCYSYHPYSFSGTLGGWSCGTLFDRVTVDGGALKIAFRDVDGQGGGWSGVNSLCWECRIPQLHLDSPPGAYNWAFGTWGQGYGSGNHEMSRKFLTPKSFYYAQLESRLQRESSEKDHILSVPGPPLNETTPTYTALMNKRSDVPELIMGQWIDTITARLPIPLASHVKEIDDVPIKLMQKRSVPVYNIDIIDGRITCASRHLTGGTHRTALWRGSLRSSTIQSASVHLTRFVPGREGKGMTDNLESVATSLKQRGTTVLNHYPALWYERRRDDHGRSRRADADVWAPFYEQPFNRSGTGEAFDRLSKYDLDEFNPWYWSRLKQFVRIANYTGLLLIQDHYLQHNIIEEGAHWTDYPWRSANNINGLGFPENTYYAGDKRVFMADQFYDTTNPIRAEYHKKNIRKYLEELSEHSNAVHHLGAEYTGPLHFVKFWLDVIHEWELETGKNAKTMLSATKDVTDSLLSDPAYAPLLDIIDIRQWHYRTDGSLYAPVGGVSLAQRQYARIMEVGNDNPDGVYRAVSEYRQAYPDKAVVYNSKKSNDRSWVSYIAGGSLCHIPEMQNLHFYADAAHMQPMKALTAEGKYWGMGKSGKGYIIYSQSETLSIDLSNDKTNYILRWIDPVTGEQIEKRKIAGGKPITLHSPLSEGVIVWLSKR